MSAVTVEEVEGRVAFRRFVELPFVLFRHEPRWAPPLAAVERTRLVPARQPVFVDGDGEYFLARRAGRIAGRISAHVLGGEDRHGWFGFFDAEDDASVVTALVERSARWLRDRDCTTLEGPVSFTFDDEAGVRTAGFEVAGTTGRQWHPPYYATHLQSAGLRPAHELPAWRSATSAAAGVEYEDDPDLPYHAGPHGDPRLSIRVGSGRIAAVPDLAPSQRAGVLALARRAKRRDWQTATVVRLHGEAPVLVPALAARAASAGYECLVAPWTAERGVAPETVHHTFAAQL